MKVLIGILSAPEHLDRRDVIRTTWMKKCTDGIQCSFLLRGNSLDYENESNALFFPEINLNETRIRGPIFVLYEYIMRCKIWEFDFCTKVDDDVWLNVPRFKHLIHTADKRENLYIGKISYTSITKTNMLNGFGYTCGNAFSATYRKKTSYGPYPFASGFLFILSRTLILKLRLENPYISKYHRKHCCLEDVWMGKQIHTVQNLTIIDVRDMIDDWGIIVKPQMLLWHNKRKQSYRIQKVDDWMHTTPNTFNTIQWSFRCNRTSTKCGNYTFCSTRTKTKRSFTNLLSPTTSFIH